MDTRFLPQNAKKQPRISTAFCIVFLFSYKSLRSLESISSNSSSLFETPSLL